MSGYGAVNLNNSMAARAEAVEARAAGEGGLYGDVLVGRDSTIIKPISIPNAPLPNRKAIRYTVKAGDTLESVARAYGVTFREITWSNPGLRLPLKAGQTLRLAPVPGVVVVVKNGDSPASPAAAYGVDEATVLGFNDIHAPELTPGLMIVIPVDPQTGPHLSTGEPADPINPGALFCPIQGAKIIQKFGATSFALEPPNGGYLPCHSGVDVLAEYGTPIVAAAGGKVEGPRFGDYLGPRVAVTGCYGRGAILLR